MQDGQLVTVGEVAHLFGVSRQRADQLSRATTFPAPIGCLGFRRVWRLSDVERWAEAHRSLGNGEHNTHP